MRKLFILYSVISVLHQHVEWEFEKIQKSQNRIEEERLRRGKEKRQKTGTLRQDRPDRRNTISESVISLIFETNS